MARKKRGQEQDHDIEHLAPDELKALREGQPQSLGEFIDEAHGSNTLAQPIDGLPSADWLQSQFRTKSAVIRYLVSQGHPIKSIARHLGMKYQHVRNVAKNELKRGPNEDWRKPYLQTKTNEDQN
jgi:hypothetical protein